MKRVVSSCIGVGVWKEGVLVLALVAWRKAGKETPIEAVPRTSFLPEVDVHSNAPSGGKIRSCSAT